MFVFALLYDWMVLLFNIARLILWVNSGQNWVVYANHNTGIIVTVSDAVWPHDMLVLWKKKTNCIRDWIYCFKIPCNFIDPNQLYYLLNDDIKQDHGC